VNWIATTISGRYLSFVGENGIRDIGGNDEALVSDGGVWDDDLVKV